VSPMLCPSLCPPREFLQRPAPPGPHRPAQTGEEEASRARSSGRAGPANGRCRPALTRSEGEAMFAPPSPSRLKASRPGRRFLATLARRSSRRGVTRSGGSWTCSQESSGTRVYDGRDVVDAARGRWR
jgi:hypothetical protein